MGTPLRANRCVSEHPKARTYHCLPSYLPCEVGEVAQWLGDCCGVARVALWRSGPQNECVLCCRLRAGSTQATQLNEKEKRRGSSLSFLLFIELRSSGPSHHFCKFYQVCEGGNAVQFFNFCFFFEIFQNAMSEYSGLYKKTTTTIKNAPLNNPPWQGMCPLSYRFKLR